MTMANRPQPFIASSTTYASPCIADLEFKDELGRGAYATVHEVIWNGTPCAAKRLHEVLLEDNSAGGTEKLLSAFKAECITWSKLRHPNVVQFLGVHLRQGSRFPVLIIEKMDTSLRRYLENHSKEKFPLDLKAFVLHQITQALAYLHSQNPPLVHHDLSINNVLLNVVSFVTKLTDFGMSRAINPADISRKSSIKGTPAFMPPEALQTPLRYNEKLDVFSFGNVILSTITHEWPQPCPPTQYKGDQLIALDEFQRRECYVEMFTAQEKQLFLPTVRRCLENRPDKRPSSVMLVQEMRCIESTLSGGSHVVAPIEQVHEQLSTKVKECKQKDDALNEKDIGLRAKDEALKRKDDALRMANEDLWQKDEVIRKKYDVILGKDEALRHQDMLICKKDEELKEKDTTIRAQQDTIQAQQALNQMQRDIIQDQKVENESLRRELMVS